MHSVLVLEFSQVEQADIVRFHTDRFRNKFLLRCTYQLLIEITKHKIRLLFRRLFFLQTATVRAISINKEMEFKKFWNIYQYYDRTVSPVDVKD